MFLLRRHMLHVCNQENYFIVKQYLFHSKPPIDDTVRTVSVVEMKRVLKNYNKSCIDGHTCIVTDCPICDNVKEPKVYVNKMTGFFMCEKCTYTGSWSILEKFITSKKTAKCLKELEVVQKSLSQDADFIEKWEVLSKNCSKLTEVSPDDYQEIFESLSLPTVPVEFMTQLNCIYSKATKSLHFPLKRLGGTIVGYKTVCIASKKESTILEPNATGLLIYRQKSIKSESVAVMVPTVQDLLALVSDKSAQVVVCLPHGLKNLPQQLLPSLESYTKLVLWFGNDELSLDTARNFAKKLDEQRCYLVRPTAKQPRPKVAASLKYDLKNIIQNAQPIWHKSITTFQSLRQDVLSDLQNIDKVQGVKWKRYPLLNRILKGHRRGEFTVLTGPTGCGKTTFMSEYSLDLALQGVNTLWGSFEIRNARLARTMLQQMAGVPLDEHLDRFNEYADAFEKLPIYFMTFHGQQNVKVVMEAVEHATYVHDIAHVIIDNVQFMMGTSDDSKNVDRFWKQDRIIGAFRTFATKNNCHVTLVIHPRKERDTEELTTSSIFGGAKASQEADNILIIQDKRLTSLRGKKYLQVAKNRYSGDLGIMILEFDKSCLSYAQKKKSKPEAAVKSEDKEQKVTTVDETASIFS